nr:ATPase family AAA domain-containing protein 5 [Aedes albopictus]
MNGSIAKYFKSPKENVQEKSKDVPEQQKIAEDGDSEAQAGPSSKVDEAPSKSEVDRMIAENMASVLKSLKKKRSHKCSKRRKNGDRKEEKEQPDDDGDEVQEVEVVDSKEPPRRSPRKTHKQESEPEKPKEEPPGKKMNAFQLMMSSRNKAIGSNSPGKDDCSGGETSNPEELKKREEKVKRKLKLEEWADRKGAGKRKLQEEAEEEFIAHQMNRRTKRLKKLIRNMEVPEDDEEGDDVEMVEEPKVSPRKKGKSPKKEATRQIVEQRGRRRLSSDDSKPSTPVPEEHGERSPGKKSEGDEFVCKLNSPLKKKDSLLGYFNKVDKSPEDAKSSHETPPTPKRTGRPRRTTVAIDEDVPPPEVAAVVEIQAEEHQNENESPLNTSSSTGRPRRACAGKIIDYAVLNGISPEKESSSGRRGRKSIGTPLKIVNANSPSDGTKVGKSTSVRSLDVDPEGTPKSTRNVKLAPLFVKKPVEDPEKVRARQAFLMSGIPEKMRLEIEKQRSFEESILNESPVFPLISHVQQLVFSGRVGDRSPLRSVKIRVKPESPDEAAIPEKENEFEFATLNDCDDSVVEDILAKLIGYGDSEETYSYVLPKIGNVKDIVRAWKQSYSHFPVFKCYKQFKAMFEEHLEESDPPPPRPSGQRKGRKLEEAIILEDSVEIVESKYGNLNGELLFTEKYKPLVPDHILVNCQPAIALKKFLSSWKEDRAGNPYDSEDDFENSNSSMSSTSSQILNHVVLVGPPGCGKTCNVYAVANEMNFNVLEINASSRRKGKIILQELQEATQSHQVRRKDEAVDIFKKSRKPSKKEARQVSIDSEGSSGSKKLSLILIEDADIVFEQDEGFITAINQLISTSKRPIVLTTTDRNCPHLSRYISNNVIRYVAPGIAHVAKLLSIMSLVEKVHLDQSELARLYALNRKDIRKTINELQFFVQSGGDRSLASEQSARVQEPELRIREDTISPSLMDDDASRQSNASSTNSDAPPARKHTALFRLFSRNQNQTELIRFPVKFDNLWCNMERVLRQPRPFAPTPSPAVTPKRKRGRSTASAPNVKVPTKDHSLTELEELVFFYENISTAARIQRDSRTHVDQDRLVNHLEEEMAHELVEISWERWFEPEPEPTPHDKRRSGVGVMCYDSLKQFDGEDCQTISSYIGINPVRSRSTCCDYEPYLRTICRCERERARVERRGSRFYHYFRNFTNCSSLASLANSNSGSSIAFTTTSFSVDHFDALSTRFEQEYPTANPTSTEGAADSSDGSR